MGGKNSAPAAPDYTPITQAAQQQAQLNYQLGEDQLAWAKQQYASDSAVTDNVVDSYLKSMNENQANAEQDRDRYESTFVPLQDQYIQQAQNYNTPAQTDFNMGQAQGAVATQYDAARQSAQQDLEAYGINPSATRYQALDVGTRTSQAAATAAAGTNAALQTQQTGRDLLANAINIGQGLPTQATNEYGVAMATGNSATSNTLAQTASGANTMGTSTQYNSIGTNDLNAWGGALNTGYQDELAQFQANQNASSGIGSILGLGAGIIGKSIFNLKDGGVAGAVPLAASPSRGAIPDDVNTNLTAGEFVMPNDAVRWYGEKALYGMVEKAGKERADLQQRSGAIPTMTPAPQQAAIPSR